MWGVHVCLCIIRQNQHPGERKLVFFCGFKLFVPPLEVTDSEYEKLLLENGKKDII